MVAGKKKNSKQVISEADGHGVEVRTRRNLREPIPVHEENTQEDEPRSPDQTI